jgi:hypothetical protein
MIREWRQFPASLCLFFFCSENRHKISELNLPFPRVFELLSIHTVSLTPLTTGNESLLERQRVSTAARNSVPATEKLTKRRTQVWLPDIMTVGTADVGGLYPAKNYRSHYIPLRVGAWSFRITHNPKHKQNNFAWSIRSLNVIFELQQSLLLVFKKDVSPSII